MLKNINNVEQARKNTDKYFLKRQFLLYVLDRFQVQKIWVHLVSSKESISIFFLQQSYKNHIVFFFLFLTNPNHIH